MHPPNPAEHMQFELRKWAFISSEQHDLHAIQLGKDLLTTCRQPPCCSRCSVLAAAMRAHAHFAPLSTIEGLEVFGSTLHARALQHPISGSGCCQQVHRARCWCIVHHLKAFGLLAPAPEDRTPHAPPEPS